MIAVLHALFPQMGEPENVRALYYRLGNATAQVHAFSRTSCQISAGSEISFECYFNAFPAAYWKRWTSLEQIMLEICCQGEGKIEVYRSKSNGEKIPVTDARVNAETPEKKKTYRFELDLDPFEDGGFLWFDIIAQTDIIVHEATWYAPQGKLPVRDGNMSIGFPTMNRQEFAQETLRILMNDPFLMDNTDAIYVIDQGSAKLCQSHAIGEIQDCLGEKLHIVEQPNFGGSGGYARIQYEAIQAAQSEFILFMDDDIVIEPECLFRILQFGRYTSIPMLVGAHMLNLQARSCLHSAGEKVDRTTFMWASASHIDYNYDLARHSYRDMHSERGGLHRRIDVEFNGWWTCLIPREVPEKIGLPLPLFLKWDDAEYGLRARKAGYPTTIVPGISVWHMAWTDKDDVIDWQAYFHLRNRLIVATLYHEGKLRGIFLYLLKSLVKHILCLEYSTIALQLKAINDFLAGPDVLFPLLETALPQVHQLRRQYRDGVLISSAKDLPPSSGQTSTYGAREPQGVLAKIISLLQAIKVNIRKENPLHHQIPQANFTPIEARWFSLGRSDGATVTAADGRGVYYRVRDRALMVALLRASMKAYRTIAREFSTQKKRYRAAHQQLTSRESWGKKFHGD